MTDQMHKHIPVEVVDREYLGVGAVVIRCSVCDILMRPESILEVGRRLASERDDLIAEGVNPALLEIPLAAGTDGKTRPTSTCHCINVAMGSYANTVDMRTPFHLRHRRDRWVVIDTCIATEIGWLWHQGVVTLNSCCGHGFIPASVIVAEDHYDLMDELGYEWRLAPSGLRAHRLNS